SFRSPRAEVPKPRTGRGWISEVGHRAAEVVLWTFEARGLDLSRVSVAHVADIRGLRRHRRITRLSAALPSSQSITRCGRSPFSIECSTRVLRPEGAWLIALPPKPLDRARVATRVRHDGSYERVQ